MTTVPSSTALPGQGGLRQFGLPILIFFAAAAATVVISGSPLSVVRFFVSAPFLLGLGAVGALAWRLGDADWERRVLIGLWSAILALSVLNILFAWAPILVYGDGNILLLLLSQGTLPGKWLGGYELIEILYAGLWQAPPIQARMPAHLAGVDVFVMLASTAAVSGGCIVLLRVWGNQLAVRLVAVTPFLLILGAGYREYYPFIICLFLGTIFFALARPMRERPAWLLGAIAGVLPAVYIGFIPWAIIFLGASLLAQPRKAWIALIAVNVAFLAVVRLLWPGSFRSFFTDYYDNLRLENRVPFQRYDLNISEDRSIFFRPGYVFHPDHVADLGFVAFYLGLALVVAIAAVGAVLLLPNLGARARGWIRDPRFWLCLGLLVQQTHYFLFMVPHFGPRHDMDVYFSVPVVAMLFAGLIWQEVLRERGAAVRRLFSAAVIPLVLGHGAALATTVLFSGMPNVYRGMDHVPQLPPAGGTLDTPELLQSFDGGSVVSTQEPELFVYATFFTTIATDIEFTGASPQTFSVAQSFAGANPLVRATIAVNGEDVGGWGGTPQFNGAGTTQFDVVLKPGRNRYSIRLEPADGKFGDASAHIGRVQFQPKTARAAAL